VAAAMRTTRRGNVFMGATLEEGCGRVKP
jgi:hypothetical protein